MNVSNLDSINDLPSFNQYVKNLTKTQDLSHLNFANTDAIDEDAFTNLLSFMNRDIDEMDHLFNNFEIIITQ